MKRIFYALLPIVLLFLSACSEKIETYKYAVIDQNVTISGKKEVQLANRFMQYWDARSRHDFSSSYTYELPYTQFIKNKNVYISEGKSTYQNYKVILKNINYDEKNNDIVWLQRQYIHDKTILMLKSKWIYINDTWYHKYTFSVFPE